MGTVKDTLQKLIVELKTDICCLSYEIERAEDQGLTVFDKIEKRRELQNDLSRLELMLKRWEQK